MTQGLKSPDLAAFLREHPLGVDLELVGCRSNGDAEKSLNDSMASSSQCAAARYRTPFKFTNSRNG
jgi:hypothetical protein